MAKFVYYWKTPDNVRHAGEIDARDRDQVFALLRAQGIRAIKVEPKGWIEGRGMGVRKRVVVALVVMTAVAVGLCVYFLGIAGRPKVEATDGGADGTKSSVTKREATLLERQEIPGDRSRVTNAPTNLFSFAAERFLARYAEPGRPVQNASEPVPPTEDFLACLKSPIMTASNDFTEHVDLKRIVTGMKRELRNYLAGGGTVEGYIQELQKRQELEALQRAKAEKRLGELMTNHKEAYAYWLRANAMLESMGIYPLPITPALRAYQQMHALDEAPQ